MPDPNQLDAFEAYLNEPNQLDTFESYLDMEKDSELMIRATGVLREEKPPYDRVQREYAMRNARNSLLEKYKDEAQVDIAIDATKHLDRSPTGRAIGGTVGSIVAPLAVGALIPTPEEAVTWPMAAAKALKAASPILGAGGGGIVGEQTQTAIEEGRLLTKREILSSMVKEMGYETGGRALFKAGRFAAGPVIKRPIKGHEQFLDNFTQLGGVMPPSQLDQRLSIRIADELSKGAFGTEDLWEIVHRKQARVGDILADHMLDEIAHTSTHMAPDILATALKEGFDSPSGPFWQLKDNMFRRLYGEIDELAKAKYVPVMKPQQRVVTSNILDEFGRPIRSVAEDMVQVGERIEGVGISTRPLKQLRARIQKEGEKLLRWDLRGKVKDPRLSSEVLELLDTINTLPDEISYSALQDLRSEWLAHTHKFKRQADPSQGYVKQFTGLMTDMFHKEAMSPKLPQEARNLLQNTNRLYQATSKAFGTTFNEKMLARVSDKPHLLVNILFPDKNPTAIRALRLGLTEPIAGQKSPMGQLLWNQLKREKLASFVDKAIDVESGRVMPYKFERLLHKFGGEKAIAELLPDKGDRQLLQGIRNMLQTMSTKPTGSAALFIKGGQVAGATMMYKGIKGDNDYLSIGVGGTLVFGPRFFVWMASKPLGNRLIRAGLKLPKGSSKLGPIAARLVNLARQEQRKESPEYLKRMQARYNKGTLSYPGHELRGFGGRGW